MSNASSPELGPARPTPLQFFLKVLSGLGGGLIGTLLLLAIFLVNAAILNPVLKNTGQEVHPLFIIVFLGMIFLSSLAANLTSTTLIALSDSGRYQRISSMVYQIFIANLIIFIIIAPIYLLAWRLNPSFVGYLAGIHVLLNSAATHLIVKIVATPAYSLLGVYSMIFAILSALASFFLLFQLTGSTIIMLFVGLPLLWFCYALFEGLIDLLYFGLYHWYGLDFLNRQTDYGSDVGAAEINNDLSDAEKAEFLINLKKDESGEEFLKKNKS